MFNNEDKIIELENRLIDLPKGYISKKTINGKVRNYYQWNEHGKKKSKYISDSNIEQLEKDIAERRNIQKELDNLYKERLFNSSIEYVVQETTRDYKTNVYISYELLEFVNNVKNFENRDCLKDIMSYLYDDQEITRVLILYGLRRTGKTTLLKQAILKLSEFALRKIAYIQINEGDSIKDLYHDMRTLRAKGFKYIFIDEVTLISDFIAGSAFLADQFVAYGMKVVLTGTDSLGFVFAEKDQLFDRTYFIDTTFIPYREFAKCLHINSIDDYIEYGGTMSLSGINYNNKANNERVNEYIDSAIAHNIQHSLKYYEYGNCFRNLGELYERNELTSAINRVVEDINHRFTVDVFTKDFVSDDLAISARNLLNDREKPTEILYEIDKEKLTKALKDSMEILNKKEQTVQIEDVHTIEVKEYLKKLNLIYDMVIYYISTNKKVNKQIVSQPGLRYVQAKQLIEQLMNDDLFRKLDVSEINRVTERLLNEVKGRMMEELVILETQLSYPNKEVFQVRFDDGEYDMVVYDSELMGVDIYEIKHSNQVNIKQIEHLSDEEKLQTIKRKYLNIKSRNVIYRGVNTIVNDINYLNVEQYLSLLPSNYLFD